jgi:hypothetical protein
LFDLDKVVFIFELIYNIGDYFLKFAVAVLIFLAKTLAEVMY